MSVPVNHVAQAAQFLTSGSGTPQEKLVMCGKVLRMAVTTAESWPPDLLEKANGILAALLTGGTVKRTVARMDAKTVNECLKQLTKDVTELANGVERARSQKRLLRK